MRLKYKTAARFCSALSHGKSLGLFLVQLRF